MIIYANDDSDFRKGDYIVMHGEMTSPPTAPDTTYILHCESFPLSEARKWRDLVSYRLVIIQRKELKDPKALEKEDGVIIHKSAKRKKESHTSSISSVFRWDNRNRVWSATSTTPMPLLMAFHRVNRINDITTIRLYSQALWWMEEDYTKAAIVYGTTPKQGDILWPKKRDKTEELPPQFRYSDQYAELLIENAPEVRNMLRTESPESLPTTLKKTKESLLEWL